MKAARIIAAGALLATGWALYAKPAKPAPVSAQDQVAVRQAAMALSAVTLGTIGNGAANGAAPKSLGFPARSLAQWADALPAMFNPATRAVPSRAKPEVFSDRAGFLASAKAFQDSTKALVAATKADDKEALNAALVSTRAACKGCHDTYQVPPPPPPKAG
jgi:cytochrome c556